MIVEFSEKFSNENVEQAGAELCKAQHSAGCQLTISYCYPNYKILITVMKIHELDKILTWLTTIIVMNHHHCVSLEIEGVINLIE